MARLVLINVLLPMKKTLMSLVLLSVLGGCAVDPKQSERTVVGVVERSQKITRGSSPPGILMAFGLVGGLLSAASSGAQTNLYVVRTADDVYTAQVDDDWATGSCVAIIPSSDAPGGRSFVYGQVRMAASDKCEVIGSQPAR